jgi:putative flippase GtrA
MRALVGFAGVGVVATLCHVLVLNLVSSFTAAPLIVANGAAYSAACLVTLFGNASISFGQRVTATAAVRFALTAAVILAVDQLYLVTTNGLGLPLWVSSWGLAVLNPALNFLSLRFFVFAGRP